MRSCHEHWIWPSFLLGGASNPGQSRPALNTAIPVVGDDVTSSKLIRTHERIWQVMNLLLLLFLFKVICF